MDDKNLISVLMPVKNEELYLAEAIQSLLRQTHENLELILVDDGSEDGTMDVAASFAAQDPRIKVLSNPKPGKVRAFNLAYKESSGDYFAFFAGDDVLPDDSLEKRIAPLLNEPRKGKISVCKLLTMSEDKKFDGIITPRGKDKGVLSGGTILFDRVFARKVFPIPEALPNEDLWPALHVQYGEFPTLHVPEVGLRYRIHERNSHNRNDPFGKKTEAMHRRFVVYGMFLEKYRSKLSDGDKSRLASLAAAETLRYSGSSLSLLLMRKLPLVDKARALFHSNASLYWIRIQLFSFFSGRG